MRQAHSQKEEFRPELYIIDIVTKFNVKKFHFSRNVMRKKVIEKLQESYGRRIEGGIMSNI